MQHDVLVLVDITLLQHNNVIYYDFMSWFVINMGVGFDKLELLIIIQNNDGDELFLWYVWPTKDV